MRVLFRVINGILLSVISCCVLLKAFVLTDIGFTGNFAFWSAVFLVFTAINIVPSPINFKIKRFKMHMCADGSDLLTSFLISATVATIVHIAILFFNVISGWHIVTYIISVLTAIVLLAITFWNGIIRVYCTSVQLGIKKRVIGALCGWIPVANIFALFSIIRTTTAEAEFEFEKEQANQLRLMSRVCSTRYPILLVHGVFFRDFKHINYWGRIPDELRRNGAQVFFGNHQSALSVADSGDELARRIKQIVAQTGCEKVNIIAHSKGGLDCRYAISRCGADKYVASLTTINTPHRGCIFADYLLKKVPEKIKNSIAGTYNKTLKKLGDTNPDFMSAVWDLTFEKCQNFNREIIDVDSVCYQSVGSKLNKARHGKFPLNFSYHFVKHFDGANDGLVSVDSFPWGSDYRLLTVSGNRGISHGDMIDLNRENIPEFDVREFYVRLVAELKSKGF